MKILKGLFLLLLIALCFTATLPALASEFCRTVEGHKICILQIQRSAKNYWEYRATVSIDDVVKPKEIYNCRRQIRIKKDGSTVPFSVRDAGDFICSYFQK